MTSSVSCLRRLRSLFLLLFLFPGYAHAGTPYFDARFRSYATPEPGRLIVADFNHDGLKDIVMNCAGGVAYMRGRADAEALGPLVLWPTGAWPNDIAVKDLNGDGHLDCVTVEQESQVSILFGNGDGTFKPRQLYPATDPSCVGIGDMNGDGRPDIIVSNYQPWTLSVMLQNANGSFADPVISSSGGFANSLIMGMDP